MKKFPHFMAALALFDALALAGYCGAKIVQSQTVEAWTDGIFAVLGGLGALAWVSLACDD